MASVKTNNLLEIDRKLKYLDLRDSLIKSTLGKQADKNGNPYYVLPTLEKEKALKALEWDKVFYSSWKKEDNFNFDKSKI